MDELRIFESPDFGQVRTVTQDGEPWFVAADVCRVLELSNPTVSVSRLDEDERAKFNLGRQGEGTIVNEPGLYTLVLGSRKPEAKAFKRWITHEVIPAIRKTGGYIAGQDTLNDNELMAKALLVAQRTIEARTLALAKANEAIGIMSPKAAYYDSVLQSENLLTVSQIAKCYGRSAAWLNQMLHGMGVQYKQGGQQWLLYQKYADKDYTRIVTIMDGTGQARQPTKWTHSGKKFIYDELKKMGIVPMSERERKERKMLRRFRRLRGEMQAQDVDPAYLGKLTGLSESQVNRRLRGQTQWQLSEMYKVMTALHWQPNRMNEMFPMDGIEKEA